MKPREAHVIRLVLNGQPPPDLGGVSGPMQRLALHLAGLTPDTRPDAFQAALAIFDPAEAERMAKTLAAVDPSGPPPEDDPVEWPATLGDLRRVVDDLTWPWPGWLASGVLNVLASDPGCGKTTLCAWLARRIWLREPWPDGQDNPFPERTPTLWVAADRHFAQLMELAASFGLPDEAMFFNAPTHDPTSGLDLDDSAELSALERRIELVRPGLVLIDTVGAATGRDLCRAEQAREFFAPLMDLAGRVSVPLLVLTHLSANGEALGRRIVGVARCLWKLTTPDPEGQPDRRRLWVDKSYAAKPPALGMTIRADGCDFDHNPPAPAAPSRGGRPPEARLKAEAFIRETLKARNDQKTVDLVNRWMDDGHGKNAFFEAVKALEAAGEVVQTTDKPKLLHLNSNPTSEAETDAA